MLTKARRAVVNMMAKGVLWPEFLIFTNQLYSFSCNYDAIAFIS